MGNTHPHNRHQSAKSPRRSQHQWVNGGTPSSSTSNVPVERHGYTTNESRGSQDPSVSDFSNKYNVPPHIASQVLNVAGGEEETAVSLLMDDRFKEEIRRYQGSSGGGSHQPRQQQQPRNHVPVAMPLYPNLSHGAVTYPAHIQLPPQGPHGLHPASQPHYPQLAYIHPPPHMFQSWQQWVPPANAKTTNERENEQIQLALALSKIESQSHKSQKQEDQSAGKNDGDSWFLGVSQKEAHVVWESSVINGKVFIPWTEDVISEEDFAGSKDFEDPDGLLFLSEKQQHHLSSWKRPKSFMSRSRVQVIIEKPSALAIRQGVVGDCSLICALATAAEYENRFATPLITKSIFPQDENSRPIYNPRGKYVCRLEVSGLPRKVEIDDQFPVDRHNKILCAHSSNSNEIWVSLLEKAYMKLGGGYAVHNGSDSGTDLHILCGWLPETLHPDSPEFDRDLNWSRILHNFHSGHCVVSLATGNLDGEVLNEDDLGNFSTRTGLVPCHAYAVLDIRDDVGFRLLKVKNPWGRKKWTGKFGDSDVENWSHDLQQVLGYDVSTQQKFDNGVFWIDFDSLCDNFRSIYISWNPECFSARKRVHEVWDGPSAGGSIESPTWDDNPQFLLEVNTAKHEEAMMVISKHGTQFDQEDFITLHIFEFHGHRVYQPRKPQYQGVYCNSNNSTARFDIPAGRQQYVIVASQMSVRKLGFTLQVCLGCDFKLTYLPRDSEHYPFEKKVEGEWSAETAGGCSNNPQLFLANPRHTMILTSPTAVVMKLRGISRDYSLNVRIEGPFRANSGTYEPGLAVLMTQTLPPGEYTIIPSTFNPGEMSPYFISICSLEEVVIV